MRSRWRALKKRNFIDLVLTIFGNENQYGSYAASGRSTQLFSIIDAPHVDVDVVKALLPGIQFAAPKGFEGTSSNVTTAVVNGLRAHALPVLATLSTQE